MMQHVLKKLKTEYPEITRAYFQQDNASCYHCASTILACQIMEQSMGIKVERLDFSDPQGGKGAAYRMAAMCMNHIRIYLNEGHYVTTAEQMRRAILSHGRFEGVRLVVLQSLNEMAELQKIPGISKLNNFQYRNGSLQAWHGYGIGQGKNIAVDKFAGQCHFANCVTCSTQFGGTMKYVEPPVVGK